MDLREYLFRKRLTVKEFSELIDCSRTHVSAIVNNRIKPSKRLAKSIELATNGEVKAEELLGKNDQEIGDSTE